MTIARYLIASLLCLSVCNVYAEKADTSTRKNPPPQYTDFDNDSDLVTNIPTPDAQEVFIEVWQLNNSLKDKKKKIAKSVKDSEFTAKDGVITAVVPGGLLYAAHKKIKHKTEKKKLAQVAKKLDDMSDGLEKLQTAVVFEPEIVMVEK